MLALTKFRLIGGAVLILAILGGVWGYGRSEFKRGVRETTADFVQRDIEGAENVRTIAEETLRSIGDDPDVERLLESTNGLRPD